MNNPSLESFAALLGEIGRALLGTLRGALRAVAAMSWPALLATCFALALALTILPLALFLFVVFMGLKLVVAALVVQARRRRE